MARAVSGQQTLFSAAGTAAASFPPGAFEYPAGDARRIRGGAVSPACRTAWRGQGVVEYRSEPANKDMPRKPLERSSQAVR